MKNQNIKQEDIIKTSEAVKMVSEEFNIHVTSTTINNWCKEHDIGKKVVGRWYVYPKKLRNLLRKI